MKKTKTPAERKTRPGRKRGEEGGKSHHTPIKEAKGKKGGFLRKGLPQPKLGVGLLGEVYHDPSHTAGYSTPWKLWKATGEKKKKVDEYLQGEDAYTLHRPARRHFKRNAMYSDNIDEYWQADLTDFQSLSDDNDGYTFVLCVIDVFSKFGWAIPLKNKTGKSIIAAFNTIFSESNRRPSKLYTDKGIEFENKAFQAFLKQHDITYAHSNNAETKAAIVERWQRTIKSKLFKRFTAVENYRYVDGLLDEVVSAYNNTYHRSIKMKPCEVTEDRVLEVYNNLYSERKIHSTKTKFKVGDYVRISREKKTFEKGYTWNWSEEIYKIIQIIPHEMCVYRVEDLDGDSVEGTFYQQELQKVTKPETFKIAYIVKSKRERGILKHLVRWRGYTDKSDSWVLDSDITK